MFKFFRKNDPAPKPGLRVICEPEPNACGGTTEMVDDAAPLSIDSVNVVFFRAESVLPAAFDDVSDVPRLTFVSAFAAAAGQGTFLFLETEENRERARDFALVKEDVLPALGALIKTLDLARSNGRFSETHGLP
ncbi:MAG: hypothetical protein II776_08365, partial [Clostridia bacterium]|nr:hypothetical protein [Clostridia bacterium]